MINLDQSIPCPACNGKIFFDTRQLLMGVRFTCVNCQSAIGLASESKPVVQHAMDKLEAIKKQNPKK